MKIAFLGYGSMAKALASKWQGKHDLFFAGRDIERAGKVANIFNAASGTLPGAVEFGEVIVLATRHEQVFDAIHGAGGANAFAGKIVVDINNPISIDTFCSTMEGKQSLTEAIKSALPESEVIKAFNMAQAKVWEDPDMSYDGRTMVTMYTADTSQAAQIGSQLIKDVGSDPLHIGGNQFAGQLEAAAGLVIKQLFSGSPPHSVLQFIVRS